MKSNLLCAALLLAALMLTGCRRAAPEETPEAVAEPVLTEKTDIDLAAWLTRPRADLSKLGDEWGETVAKQLQAIRSNPESVDLLPRLLPPLTVPVFAQAKFDPAVGFSLPPYVEAGKKDAALAVHLARFGDAEAAQKVAPENPALRTHLQSLKAEKNYPVEWTRLVGLVMISNQVKLSTGDTDGASELMLVHRQLATLLDPQAARGPLGSVLLSMGKSALERAAAAWREPKRNNPNIAETIEKSLAEWGPVPASTPAVAFGAPAEQVEGLFGVAKKGKAVIVEGTSPVMRVVELLGLPLSSEGVQVAGAFLDDRDRLTEFQFALLPKIDTLYATPRQVAYRLVEAGYVGKGVSQLPNLVKETFTGADIGCEIARCNRSLVLGGLIRLASTKNEAVAARLQSLREFGPLSLDRGFDTNRMALSPEQPGPVVLTRSPQTMKKVAVVLDTPVPQGVLLQRDSQVDVVDRLELVWAPGIQSQPLEKILPSLWDDYGPGKLVDVEDKGNSHLAFVWSDDLTQVSLNLPFDERAPVLSIQDTQGPTKALARAEAVQRLDEQARMARMAARKPEVRLARTPGDLNGLNLNKLHLGISKAEAEAALPRGATYRRKDLPNGVSVVILSNPDAGVSYWARQLLLRYEADRVVELRVRYQLGLSREPKDETLLGQLRQGQPGVGEAAPPTWAGLWADQTPPGKLTYFRWRDDRTERTYQEDVGGAEVIWLDRSARAPVDRPWKFVSRGVEGCRLGDTRRAVEAALKAPASTSDGAQVYRMPGTTPYEMMLVWYDKDTVSRILAIGRDRPKSDPKEVQASLAKAWGRSIDSLGYICRQLPAHRRMLGAYFWHDDKVRVQASVQNTDQGVRSMMEWRFWPVQGGPEVTRAD